MTPTLSAVLLCVLQCSNVPKFEPQDITWYPASSLPKFQTSGHDMTCSFEYTKISNLRTSHDTQLQVHYCSKYTAYVRTSASARTSAGGRYKRKIIRMSLPDWYWYLLVLIQLVRLQWWPCMMLWVLRKAQTYVIL